MTGFFHYGRDRARQSSAPPAATAPACRSLRQYRRACVLPRFRSVRTVPYFTRLASPPLGNARRALGIDESPSRSSSAILRAAGPLPGWLRMIRQGILRENGRSPRDGLCSALPPTLSAPSAADISWASEINPGWQSTNHLAVMQAIGANASFNSYCRTCLTEISISSRQVSDRMARRVRLYGARQEAQDLCIGSFPGGAFDGGRGGCNPHC